MEGFRIDTGRITLEVNDSGETISFNPNDPQFAKDFAEMLRQVSVKEAEYVKRFESLNNSQGADANSIEKLESVIPMIQLQEEFCIWCEGQIDKVFGAETCRKVFGGDKVPEAYADFIEQITPHIQSVRKQELAKRKKPVKK